MRPTFVALHGEVGRLALGRHGACRTDLLAIAINPRALPGVGPDTVVRVDLDRDGRASLWIACDGVPLDAVVAIEPLAPLPDEAGYREPAVETAGDRERRRDRAGLRRTR